MSLWLIFESKGSVLFMRFQLCGGKGTSKVVFDRIWGAFSHTGAKVAGVGVELFARLVGILYFCVSFFQQ